VNAGQSFPVVVDYAHTPDSLEALYGAFAPYRKICVLGNTGGGRDKWKRPVMGSIAESHCDTIILTNEDPYDEDPRSILEEIASGMHTKKPEIILDRKEAIERAVSIARDTEHAAVLITGKGTDPYIMGPKGSRIPWDDATVARAALEGSAKEA
jgi:UDP-N-acetylmuramoyl-L-alanyl-D-glutamate--2,6-diaminopimelate ligase